MAFEAEAGVPSARFRRRRRAPRDLTTPSLLGLPLAWLAVFFVVPIAIVAAYSFDVYSLYPGKHGFTLAAWRAFRSQPQLTASGEPLLTAPRERRTVEHLKNPVATLQASWIIVENI